jgi:molybdate transport system substrate-binding protein
VSRLVSILFVVLSAVLSGHTTVRPAGQSTQAATVRVAAASDLRFALEDVIARLARLDSRLKIEATYGSSGNFHAQLQQRAPFDLFLSADVEYPRDLVAKGIGSERDLFVYATGRLVVWLPNQSTLPIERDYLRVLLSARRIAMANPRHAPYGRAAEAALRAAGIWSQVEPRLVLGENVSQAAQFVQSGAADAGLVAMSLAVAPAMRAAGRYWEVPAGEYPPLVQGGLVLPWASSRDAALRVRDYLMSVEGRRVLEGSGLGPAGPTR